MDKKKDKVLTYLASAIIPILIFALVAGINGYLSGEVPLNPYDAYYQYSGMTLEFARNLKGGNIFYSFGAGLGFNLFGALCYYCMSPLNILSVFANSQNYPFFIAVMTFLRFSLLGLSMCFYLDHRGLKKPNTVLFSVLYSLMGFASTYFYNFMWIDSIIMLPLVIHGLDKILENKSGTFYTIALTLSILFNYYIGYMICIFSLIWFLYKIFFIKDKKPIIQKFIICSLLSGLMSTIVLFPSFFALMAGKGTLFNTVEYGGVSNLGVYTYMLSTGAYSAFSYLDGPALIYSGIISLVLLIFYFANPKFSKKEKVATFAVIIFFLLSFNLNFLNYAWQLFQRPIWWQSRFSFLFSFFLIVTATKSLEHIELSRLKISSKILIWLVITVLIVVGDCLKHGAIIETLESTSVYVLLSSILILVMHLLVDRKKTFALIAIFTLLDLTMNTFNVLVNIKNSATFREEYAYLKTEVPDALANIENDTFYRLDATESYTASDGLYFGYNGIDYFNSTRNMKVIEFFKKIGAAVQSDCYVALTHYDPVLYSLLNVAYIYGDTTDYYEKIEGNLYKNRYPLSLGFIGENTIKDLELPENDIFQAREIVVQALSGLDDKLYILIPEEEFKKEDHDDKTTYTYSFESSKTFFPIFNREATVEINGVEVKQDEHPLLHKGDKVKITFQKNEQKIELHLLDIDAFEHHMDILSRDLLVAHTNANGHILEGEITVTEDDKYLFTTVEYEKGMKVYVDGELIEPDVILGTLIGFELSKGDHNIAIDYIPEGFTTGSIVSALSLISFIVYTTHTKKTEKCD